jgi:hypothetical protein
MVNSIGQEEVFVDDLTTERSEGTIKKCIKKLLAEQNNPDVFGRWGDVSNEYLLKVSSGKLTIFFSRGKRLFWK